MPCVLRFIFVISFNYVYVHMNANARTGQSKGVRYPTAEVTGGCELPCGCLELNPSALNHCGAAQYLFYTV